MFSWRSLGAILVGALLAKWTWVLLAPASPAMPATVAWKKTDDAERLFGAAAASGVAAATSPLGDIRLVGVFAHKTAGFAVLQTGGKQVGVALGEEVTPGVRLVETHADHVIVERGSLRQRVDMANAVPAAPGSGGGATPVPAASPAGAAALVPAAPSVASAASAPANARATFDVEAATAALDKLPPGQREAMKHQIEIMRRGH